MGCITSKQAKPVTVAASASPVLGYSVSAGVDNAASVILQSSSRHQFGCFDFDNEKKKEEEKEKKSDDHHQRSRELRKQRRGSKSGSFTFKLGFSQRFVEAEQIAAGWPAWLTATAGEAVHGWVPLRADAFEKLDKIGQGTYSNVFQAREIETGKMVALKKVRFDNFQPESIRFMAREISILRRLDHPNIMKLEGVITSRMSSSIYLVFEYMEHDLAGLSSSPDIKFTESQVKCYMRQLLRAMEHCHLLGVMHRDIKASNILVNNEGILKVGDFGLANVLSPRNKQQLTSRVVTLWYRPPELLMGSTNYGVSVDLWSVGCVFAELIFGKPILKGRTEVEQLHKIFKLCGSPPEEFWRKSKLPHATMFRPQHYYESSFHEMCKDLPTATMDLMETFLSIEPEKRGTASSALNSEYFHTKPLACDPSSLPKYAPNKEIDAKHREDLRRMRDSGASRKARRGRKTLQQPDSFNRFAPKEEAQHHTQSHRKMGNDGHDYPGRGGALYGELQKPAFDTMSETCKLPDASQAESHFVGPEQITASSGFSWAKRQREDAKSTMSYTRSSSRSQFDSSSLVFAKDGFNLTKENDTANDTIQRWKTQFDRIDALDESSAFHSQDLSAYDNQATFALRSKPDYINVKEKVDFSGPLLSQAYGIDDLLRRNESHIRRAARRSRPEREK
ncbi:ATP binding protein putative isoform 1 [Tripterygium wilfordii]|uniref:ATP binding protein putative isoform 1 n=1 Tax=Tripterygium wilfordii TaxID=458696 RepID=A0A7J7BTN0_TRIWF|nr:ATP binding protein putative isoform 1 [Tripterygium wilfordii]